MAATLSILFHLWTVSLHCDKSRFKMIHFLNFSRAFCMLLSIAVIPAQTELISFGTDDPSWISFVPSLFDQSVDNSQPLNDDDGLFGGDERNNELASTMLLSDESDPLCSSSSPLFGRKARGRRSSSDECGVSSEQEISIPSIAGDLVTPTEIDRSRCPSGGLLQKIGIFVCNSASRADSRPLSLSSWILYNSMRGI